MLSTWKFAAVCWFSSPWSWTIFRSERSAAISSSTGATTRHGPHQGAQKSTRTGPSASRTSAWKLVSVTSERVPAMSGSLEGVGPALYKVKCSLGAGRCPYGKPTPPSRPTTPGGRPQDPVDDGDDAVGGLDVGLGPPGRAVEVDLAAPDRDLHGRAVDRLGALERDDLRRGHLALDHVVGQDGLEHGLVLGQRREGGLGDLG